MTSPESHRHSRVITVAAKTSASSKLKQTGDRKSSRNRNTSIAKKMWDSFESGSSSGDDTEHDEQEAQKPLQSDGERPAIGLLLARKDVPDCALKSNPPAVDAKEPRDSASNEDIASCRDNQFQSNIYKEDDVCVRLASDEQAKGTISRVSSRGTHDLTLSNGKTLNDADLDALTIASRRRKNSFRNPEHRARSRSDDHNDKESDEDNIPECKGSSKTAAQPSLLTKESIGKPAEYHLASPRPSDSPENSGAAEEEQQESESSDLSSVGSMKAEASKMVVINSEVDGHDRRDRDQGSTSEQGSLPVANTAQHAEGLLKKIVRRNADEVTDGSFQDTVDEKPNRNTPRVTANSHRNEEDPIDPKDSEDSINPAIVGENEHKTIAEGALDGAGENGAMLGNGSTRGLSISPRKHVQKSKPSTSYSRSLVVNIGNTLRGAIMGKTQLGVCDARGKHTRVDGPEGNSSSEGSYFSGGGEAGHFQHENHQHRSRLKGKMSQGNTGEDVGPGDGFDSDVFASPTTRADGLKNLPEVVSSYIEARARMERQLSASGPKTAAGPREGAVTSWVRRQASVDITKEASSTTQLSVQRQPFTEAMLKIGVSETKHSTKQGILLEGDLQKFSPESVRGVRWHKRYFVLYGGSGELRYYRNHAEASWGRVPLGERGSIPLRLVVKIEQPSDKKYQGNRFNLVVLHKGSGRHPGLHIRPGHETRVTTTKTYKFSASDAQQRLLWVTVIEALMKRHGWGMDVERNHESCVIGVGATSGSLMETERGRKNSAASIELHRAGPGDVAPALGYDARLSHLQFGNASSKSMTQRLELGPNFPRLSLLTTMEDGVNVRDSWRRHPSGWSTATFDPSQRETQIPHSP